MADLVIAGILLLAVGAAAAYIIKAKKKWENMHRLFIRRLLFR